MNIAVSACLLGKACRFDGEARPCDAVIALASEHTLVPICPESLGRLPIPRLPNEIVASEPTLHVVDSSGADNTAAFVAGAQKALRRAQESGCELAILKAKSPSCGKGLIYDGTFSGSKVPGNGVTAALLLENGIPVYTEEELEDAL